MGTQTKAILEHFSESMVNYQWAVMMVQLIVMLYFVGHFMACMYYYFSTSQWHTERERDLLADPDVRTSLESDLGIDFLQNILLLSHGW